MDLRWLILLFIIHFSLAVRSKYQPIESGLLINQLINTTISMDGVAFVAKLSLGSISPFTYIVIDGVSIPKVNETPFLTQNIEIKLKCYSANNDVIITSFNSNRFTITSGKDSTALGLGSIFPNSSAEEYFRVIFLPFQKDSQYTLQLYGGNMVSAQLSNDVPLRCAFGFTSIEIRNVKRAQVFLSATSWIINSIPFHRPFKTNKAEEDFRKLKEVRNSFHSSGKTSGFRTSVENRKLSENLIILNNKNIDLADIWETQIDFHSGDSWRIGGYFKTMISPDLSMLHLTFKCGNEQSVLKLTIYGMGMVELTSRRPISNNSQDLVIDTWKSKLLAPILYEKQIVDISIIRSIYSSSAIITVQNATLPYRLYCSANHVIVSTKTNSWTPLYTSNHKTTCMEYGAILGGTVIQIKTSVTTPLQCYNSCLLTESCHFWFFVNNKCTLSSDKNYYIMRTNDTTATISGPRGCDCYAKQVMYAPISNRGYNNNVLVGQNVTNVGVCQQIVLKQYGTNSNFMYQTDEKNCYRQVMEDYSMTKFDKNVVSGPTICTNYLYHVTIDASPFNILDVTRSADPKTMCKAICDDNKKCAIFTLSSDGKCRLFHKENSTFSEILNAIKPDESIIVTGIHQLLIEAAIVDSALEYFTNKSNTLSQPLLTVFYQLFPSFKPSSAFRNKVSFLLIITTIIILLIMK